MKNITVKKIVLCSIGAFASLMLLIGLAFPVLAYDAGLGNAVNGAIGQLGLSANGFTMLSFKFPQLLFEGITTYVKSDICELFVILLGLTSLLSLVFSLLSLGIIVYAFFRFSTSKCNKLIMPLLVTGLIVSLVHSVLAIIFSSIVQIQMEKILEEQFVVGSFGTTAFISAIFQVVCLVAYLICENMIKEKDVERKTKLGEKETAENKGEYLLSVIKAELTLVKLLKEYKQLYDETILSAADYIDKKVKILKYSEQRVQRELAMIVNKCPLEKIAEAESFVVVILKEYKTLLDAGVISDADFVQKKVALLGYIIN